MGKVPPRSPKYYSSDASKKDSRHECYLVNVTQQFQSVPPPKRNKATFMAAISAFKEHNPRGHVEFINTALKFIKDYGIHKDLDVYKALLNVFPKGKMIPQNVFQRMFMHYPMQQICCVKVLDEMEWHGVQPDKEIHDIVVNVFGKWNYATKKIKRMLYWMPKLKHSNKYLDRRIVEGQLLSSAELAGIALKMMIPDPGTSVSLIKITQDDIVDGWLAFGQSSTQKKLINELSDGTEIFIDGPFRVYVMEHQVQYIVMSFKPTHEQQDDDFEVEEFEEDLSKLFIEWKNEKHKRFRSVHEQKNETILALGAMFRQDNTTASLWLERFQYENPSLSRFKTRIRLDKGAPYASS
ncbi:ECSIT protein [Dictyocaulus viviparus]|uniref:Evolutionarily conserved signaling intermediate in Toll pathway, mitochondrial n=1 Tax=Dictyocaulus viviparus TaxID=29172 RepID=A0A0D8Y630_DICVI|nr:ECSIT protein [Dictyocaulus viviparus]